VFNQTSHGRTGPIELHSDGLFPRIPLLSLKTTERRIKALTKLIPHFTVEQTLEVCADELETKSSNLSILALYRAPSAKF
jgi:hypothetical protein